MRMQGSEARTPSQHMAKVSSPPTPPPRSPLDGSGLRKFSPLESPELPPPHGRVGSVASISTRACAPTDGLCYVTRAHPHTQCLAQSNTG